MNVFTHLVAKPFIGLAASASLMMGGMMHTSTTTSAQTNASAPKTTQVQKTQNKDAAGPTAQFSAKGKVALLNAKVTSISGASLTAVETWGATTLSWAVNAASTTVSAKDGATLPLSSIAVGDTVNIHGSLDATVADTINASRVHDTAR
jgi:hypothetical protein